MSGVVHISVELALGLVDSCEASTGRSGPSVIDSESSPSWIPTVLLSGWASGSTFEIAALLLITEIDDEADCSVCARLSARQISSPKWEDSIDRLDRRGFSSVLASRPVPFLEGGLSSILLSSDVARSDTSLAQISGSGIQPSLLLPCGNFLADASL